MQALNRAAIVTRRFMIPLLQHGTIMNRNLHLKKISMAVFQKIKMPFQRPPLAVQGGDPQGADFRGEIRHQANLRFPFPRGRVQFQNDAAELAAFVADYRGAAAA